MQRDTLHPVSAEQLFASVLYSLKTGSIFGIYRSLFFQPEKNRKLQTSVFGQPLDTPVGLAAGPHTQMAQNIIAGWLCGARYIELKTVQTLDEIEVKKPCIDISDEGYNCEWSQELKIEQSFEEYLKAWVIIHILQYELNFPEPFGTVFNMSVGYDMKGILQDNMQRFFEKMRNCSEEKARMIDRIRPLYPAIDKISIPATISDNVTLSTMHGCPAGEIETIGRYLIEEKGLHTFIKLNPTLLGKDEINAILDSLGFETDVPDVAFEHDIDFLSACRLVRSLQKTSLKHELFFGIKLTNTLESKNNKNIFTPENMYMSGKALHPVSMNTAAKLRNEFPDLPLSFCGGVNADNISDVVAGGMHPVTVCTDLLQPGGYTKLLQYLENIPAGNTQDDPAAFLNRYAEKVKTDKRYAHEYKNIKTDRPLKEFDCISAPCVDTCPAHQNIPAYLDYIYRGENRKALETILYTNPFPFSTGMICDHSCQSKCTRINYDSAIRIRDVKRYIAENSETMSPPVSGKLSDKRIAVIGAGPSGLSCAYYLARAGCRVDVYEKKEFPGGMLASAIPEFRLSREALDNDISLIESAGVKIHTSQQITKDGFRELKNNSDYLYIAVGAQKAIKGNIPGLEKTSGVLDPLEFLSLVRERRIPDIGKNIVVLGGGNTAIDVARTARRIAGKDSRVSIVYRRSRKEMPADDDEIKAAGNENITLTERAAPARAISENGKIIALECHRMRLVEEENSERPKPVIIPGAEFSIPADTVIPAFGQSIDADFLDEKLLRVEKVRETRMKNVFIGGDAYRGASFLIQSIADGKEVAKEILQRAGAWLPEKVLTDRKRSSREEHHGKLSRIVPRTEIRTVPRAERTIERLVELPMNMQEVRTEASRCLNCDEICDICVTVCPNRANIAYKIAPGLLKIQKIIIGNGDHKIVPDESLSIEQKYQILNIADLCNECGNCSTFCPTSGRPFADKPRIALTGDSYRSLETGYRIKGDCIFYKENGEDYILDRLIHGYMFRTADAEILLDKSFNVLEVKNRKGKRKEILLRNAVKMRIIRDTMENMYPFLIK